ncbi:MXAN_5187 C-terminal domain-containing protein [Luteitalea sp.]|uniref:MXAN_5187 C-terminal domain-containing protein n=1 Tax=Luteitalea sp. TaxID=2004800 RepID=UPI0037C73AC8
MPQPSALERDLQALTVQLKKVEAEYTMYFSGRTGRPPLESRAALDRAFRRFDRAYFDSAVLRFQFSTLQARYSTFCDLWDRGVRAREEGRGGPFVRQAPASSPAAPDVVHATRLVDPVQEADKLRTLYEALMEARRDEGREVVPFHRFADMVREQVRTLRERHPGDQVWFRVTRIDGRVNLTAQAVKAGRGESDDE